MSSVKDNIKISVQQADFDAGALQQQMRLAHPESGALVSFIGQVRDLNEGVSISSMHLEHYPGMTEKSLSHIAKQATQRWPLSAIEIIHRFGDLKPLDQIVLVLVASAHRHDAFAACEFVMDYLKTEAPFWKKESTSAGERWVEAKATDDVSKARWNQCP
jgi:molybdopterin synthase catalytic subunit